ncbi:MAG TPA: hypothetical protein PLZ57_15740 [Pseudobdellovibrionaceae bacterium]|nr:hypothetical protein [Pseudobdellovibrionaceae bacterium]
MANDNIIRRAPDTPTPQLETQIAPSDSPFSRREEFLRDQLQCCLCGEHLAFTHKVELSEDASPIMIMREEAHCPTCRIPLRRERHAIQ